MNKYAVISFTPDDKYAFFAPIVHWCWSKLGIGVNFIIPRRMVGTGKLELILRYTQGAFYQTFDCPKHKEATYAQVSRLYSACGSADDDVLITSDIDMAVFRDDFPTNYAFNVLGYDLVPEKQYPMCYAWATARIWDQLMEIEGSDLQGCLDEQLGHVECDNFRGNQWSFDQSLLYRQVAPFGDIRFYPRARPGTQFAADRADRDDTNWISYTGTTLLDAHLWRPGYEDGNFDRIYALLTIQFPNEDLRWLHEYRYEYIHLL